jgi:tetratricopeptide (TPR) repeat protein
MSNAAENPREDQPADTQFQRDFEQVIKSYAEATEAGKPEEATQAALSALMMAANESMRNPTPWVKLAEKADKCKDVGDWAGAEAVYRQMLILKETSENLGLRAKSQMDLSRLLRQIGRLDEAWDFALAATESARGKQISTLVAMALESQASCALDRGDTRHALQASSEAVTVLETDRLTAHMRARMLVLRGECLLACDDVPSADDDLRVSRELLDEVSPGLPGPTLTQAQWWEVRAKLDLRAERLKEAAESLTQAIRYRRLLTELHGTTSPHLAAALAKDYEALGELARRRGDSAAALDAALQAKHLREQAHLPVPTDEPVG